MRFSSNKPLAKAGGKGIFSFGVFIKKEKRKTVFIYAQTLCKLMVSSKEESRKTVAAKRQLGEVVNYCIICNSTLLSGYLGTK